jgi:hypothetical protein
VKNQTEVSSTTNAVDTDAVEVPIQ